MFWFYVNDTHSGGGTKTPYEGYYIEAVDEDTAVVLFEAYSGHSIWEVACSCCGPSFSVYEVGAYDVRHNNSDYLVIQASDYQD